MSKTKDQLIRKALQYLGVVNGSDPVDASDNDVLTDMIEPMLSDLSARGVYSNGNPTEFEDGSYPFLAIILGNMVARDFGVPVDLAAVAFAESRLIAQSQVSVTSGPVEVEYW